MKSVLYPIPDSGGNSTTVRGRLMQETVQSMQRLSKRVRLRAQQIEIGFVAEDMITTAASGFSQHSSVNESGYSFGGGRFCCSEQLHRFGYRHDRMGRQILK